MKIIFRSFLYCGMYAMCFQYFIRNEFNIIVLMILFGIDLLNSAKKERLKQKIDTSEVTRVEIIDHTRTLAEGGGRVFVKNNSPKVELELQDDNRTLKIFISKIKQDEQESKKS